MRCHHCGRTLTFHRAEEHPPVVVVREDMTRWLTLQDGAKVRPQIELEYCGTCFFLERHKHQAGDVYGILLGDSRVTERWELVTMEVAA